VDNAAGVDNTWIDRYHTLFEGSLFSTGAWFDRFFGEDRVDMTEQPETFLRWRNEFRWLEVLFIGKWTPPK
jgi:hypothetical protein